MVLPHLCTFSCTPRNPILPAPAHPLLRKAPSSFHSHAVIPWICSLTLFYRCSHVVCVLPLGNAPVPLCSCKLLHNNEAAENCLFGEGSLRKWNRRWGLLAREAAWHTPNRWSVFAPPSRSPQPRGHSSAPASVLTNLLALRLLVSLALKAKDTSKFFAYLSSFFSPSSAKLGCDLIFNAFKQAWLSRHLKMIRASARALTGSLWFTFCFLEEHEKEIFVKKS